MEEVTRYIVSPRAANDMESILRYLTREASVAIALAIEDGLFRAYHKLARTPMLGHRRRDLTDRDDFRFYLTKPYLIVFQPLPGEIVIHAVLHGARDVKQTLVHRDIM